MSELRLGRGELRIRQRRFSHFVGMYVCVTCLQCRRAGVRCFQVTHESSNQSDYAVSLRSHQVRLGGAVGHTEFKKRKRRETCVCVWLPTTKKNTDAHGPVDHRVLSGLFNGRARTGRTMSRRGTGLCGRMRCEILVPFSLLLR